jgi:ubiquitin-conjugating enzyme E2 variant
MKFDRRPFFFESTPFERSCMRVSVGANLTVIASCAVYLFLEYELSGVTWPYIVAGILGGYLTADFASGLIHWGMDTWFDQAVFGRAVAIAREHHTHPQHILAYGFLEHATLGSAPSAVFIGLAVLLTAGCAISPLSYCFVIIWLITSTCLFFGTSFHNLGHRRPRSAFIRVAQKMHLIISPEHHWVHHRDDQVVRYCVINGWANHPCDRLHVWRRLEWLVRTLTGAVPRTISTGSVGAKSRAPLGLKRGFAQRNYIFAVSIEEVIRHHDELAARHSLPAVYPWRFLAELGGLIA